MSTTIQRQAPAQPTVGRAIRRLALADAVHAVVEQCRDSGLHEPGFAACGTCTPFVAAIRRLPGARELPPEPEAA